MNEIIGLTLGLCIGAACRWFDIPVPAPPRIVGALLVVAMTLGFIGTDMALAAPAGAESTQKRGRPIPVERKMIRSCKGAIYVANQTC